MWKGLITLRWQYQTQHKATKWSPCWAWSRSPAWRVNQLTPDRGLWGVTRSRSQSASACFPPKVAGQDRTVSSGTVGTVSPKSQWDFREPVRRPATCAVLKREAPFCWVLFAIYTAIPALSRTLSPASHRRLGLSVLSYHFTKGDLKKAVPGSWLSQGNKVTTRQERQF